MTSKSQTNNEWSKLSFDISEDKEAFKEQITNSINGQFKSTDREDVKKAVDDKYEELLKIASVTQHIPAITEGLIKSKYQAIERENKSSL
jgi:hypothetical protein